MKLPYYIYDTPFLGTVIRKWDSLVHRLAVPSFNRMVRHNPGLAYLMELHAREHVKTLNLSPALRQSTEDFFYALNALEQNKNNTTTDTNDAHRNQNNSGSPDSANNQGGS